MMIDTREIKARVWLACWNLLDRSKRRRLSRGGRSIAHFHAHEGPLPVHLPNANSYTAWAVRAGKGGLIATPAKPDGRGFQFKPHGSIALDMGGASPSSPSLSGPRP